MVLSCVYAAGLRVTVPREGMPLHNFPSDKGRGAHVCMHKHIASLELRLTDQRVCASGHLRVTLNVVFPTKLSKQQEGDVRALFHKHRR